MSCPLGWAEEYLDRIASRLILSFTEISYKIFSLQLKCIYDFALHPLEAGAITGLLLRGNVYLNPSHMHKRR
jgi:hypothetical protein